MTATWAKLGAGRVAYYQCAVATGREDYYAGHGEAQGRWTGEGARLLGLAGELREGDLTRMANGQHPMTGEQLRSAAGADPERRVGAFDFTFSCAKSVSLLYASGDRELSARILDAHDRAVEASLRALESEAAFIRRGKGGAISYHAEGLMIARYRHRTSRAGDPQLHEHCIVGNQGLGPDGRWTALDGVRLREFKMALGAIHEAEVRANVAELGLTWRPLGANGLAELDCIDPATLRHFSKRRIEIENAARGEGAAAMAGAAIETRAAKHEVNMPAIEREVSAMLGPERIEAVRGAILDNGSPADLSRKPLERLTDARIITNPTLDDLAGPEGLTRLRNSFSRADVIVAVARSAPQGMHADEVLRQTDAFLERADVIERAGGRWTTQDLLDAEKAREAAQLGRLEDRTGLAREKNIRDGIRGAGLNGGQEEVVRSVFASGRGVEIVEAAAGTGKTFTASAIRRVAELDDRPVIGTAPTGRARDELQSQAGITSHTLDSLLGKLDRGDIQLTRRTIVVADEMGMAGTRLAARLEQHAQAAGCKVIEIRDSRQLQSVLAGGTLQDAHERLGGLELTEVVRQRDPEERRALGRLRAGHVEGWLEHVERDGRVHYGAELDQSVDKYLENVREVGFKEAALIVPTNQMAKAANSAARERLAGELGPERNGFRVGDRVVWLRNDGFGDSRVSNGDRGTVIGNSRQALEVERDDGGRRYVQPSYIAAGDLQLGYAVTIHKSQGSTVDRCVVATRPGELYSELAYVAASRARDSTDLFVVAGAREDERAEIGPVSLEVERNQREELIRAMSQSRAEDLASDQAPELVRGREMAGLER